jgi:hypothetical protein
MFAGRFGLLACAVAAVGSGCGHARTRPALQEGNPGACATSDLDRAWTEVSEIEARPPDDGGTRLRAAAHVVGQALYCRGLYVAALASFQRAGTGDGGGWAEVDRLIAGRDAAAHVPTLRWLLLLARRFPQWDDVADTIGRYDRAQLDDPTLADVRDELHYQAARAAYRRGDFKGALALLATVAPDSASFVYAKLLEGAVHVREYHATPAVAAFEAAQQAVAQRVAAQGGGPAIAAARDLAAISSARTFYSAGQYPQALLRYDRIAAGSPYWLETRLEHAWTQFQLEAWAKAVADLEPLLRRPDAVAPEMAAEALLMKASIAAGEGHAAERTNGVRQFMRIYPARAQQLRNLASAHPNDDEMFDVGRKILEGRSGLPPGLEAAARGALTDVKLTAAVEMVDELAREIAALDGATYAPTTLPARRALRDDLAARQRDTVTRAASRFRNRLIRSAEALRILYKRALNLQMGQLRSQRD